MKAHRGIWPIIASLTLAWCGCAAALNPSLEVNQYAHTAWTVREGFSLGNVYAIAQTQDGYLWLAGEFGLARFDGVRIVPWRPPPGQQLPFYTNSLMVARNGTLWIGTMGGGLASWDGTRIALYPNLGSISFITSLFEDREGTV